MRIIRNAAVGLIFAGSLVFCQSISLGVKGGVPLTDAVEGSFGVHSEAPRYVIGPMVEIGLPFSLALEVDALYRRTGYSTASSAFGTTSVNRVRANSWEFPLLAKYYFSRRALVLRPYVSGGYVVRNLSGVEGVNSTFGTNPLTGSPFSSTLRLDTTYLLRDNPTHGFAVGAGGRLRFGPLRVAPEIRYTRWTGRSFDEQGSQGFYVRSAQNQVDVLLGLTF